MRILAPHKEQEGWRYVRIPASVVNPLGEPDTEGPRLFDCGLMRDPSGWQVEFHYPDTHPQSRIISSRRVEEAVETADFLKLCAEEGLWVGRDCNFGWSVGKRGEEFDAYNGVPLKISLPHAAQMFGHGDTLREAYYRFKATQ